MPDFDIVLTGAGISASVWVDQPVSDAASRLNSDPVFPPLFQRVAVPTTVHLTCVVDGVAGPPDSALDGRLFEFALVEFSGPSLPAITYTAGSTSKVSIALTAGHVGHFLAVFRRPGGGAVGLPFDGVT